MSNSVKLVSGERQLFGPDIIKEAEDQVRIIQERLKTAQSRQKSYYDCHHQDISYEVGDKEYLRVTSRVFIVSVSRAN